jgi:hypothetical protein
MSGAIEIAETAVDHIETLLSDMYEAEADNNYMLLGTVGTNEKPIQIQLIVTRNPNEFFDEM